MEEIRGLVYKASKNGKKENKIIEEVISKIALTLPQDAIFQIIYNNNIMYKDLFLKYYLDGEHLFLVQFLINMDNKKMSYIHSVKK